MDNDQATLTSQDDVIAEPTMNDTMAETLAEIRNRDTQEEKPVETAKPDKLRDEQGKFARAAETATPDKVQSAEQSTKPADIKPAEPAQTAPVATIDPSIQPPSSYTNEGKSEFLKASPALQKEVLKREADFHKYLHNQVEPMKQAATFGQDIYKAIQPFENTIRSWNTTPAQAIQALFHADQKLTQGSPQEKLRAFTELAKGYGIDLSQGLPEQAPIDPNVEYLQRQNQQAMQAAQAAHQKIQRMEAEFTQRQQASEQEQLNSVIEQAKQGKPHFDELRQEIGMILQSAINKGQLVTIDQAYEAAMWQSPMHRAELLAKQQAEAEAAAAQKRAEDAEKAKAAKHASSVNVARRGTLPAQAPVGSVEDSMRETLAAIKSR